MADSGNSKTDDLWKSFENEEKLAPGKTDGSQWTGKFDRRKKPRDQPGDNNTNGSTPSAEDSAE